VSIDEIVLNPDTRNFVLPSWDGGRRGKEKKALYLSIAVSISFNGVMIGMKGEA